LRHQLLKNNRLKESIRKMNTLIDVDTGVRFKFNMHTCQGRPSQPCPDL